VADHPSCAARQRGQATVELALCVPVLAFLAAVLVQIGLVAAMQTRVWHAAREAARVAVVDPDEEAAEAAVRSAGVHDFDLKIEPGESGRRMGEPLTVSLMAHQTGGVPLVSAIFERVTLRAQASMRIEQP
jgi:Flp pilus assembly protein TadG